MRKEVTVELPQILDQTELNLPSGWFTIYHCKTPYSIEGLRKVLKRMEKEGLVESKLSRVKSKGIIKNMTVFRKI